MSKKHDSKKKNRHRRRMPKIAILISVLATPKGQPPQIFGFSGFRVLTGSMEPSIPTDSFVLV